MMKVNTIRVTGSLLVLVSVNCYTNKEFLRRRIVQGQSRTYVTELRSASRIDRWY
jgi:hypothetical protein